jgi:hypothetical protein
VVEAGLGWRVVEAGLGWRVVEAGLGWRVVEAGLGWVLSPSLERRDASPVYDAQGLRGSSLDRTVAQDGVMIRLIGPWLDIWSRCHLPAILQLAAYLAALLEAEGMIAGKIACYSRRTQYLEELLEAGVDRVRGRHGPAVRGQEGGRVES